MLVIGEILVKGKRKSNAPISSKEATMNQDIIRQALIRFKSIADASSDPYQPSIPHVTALARKIAKLALKKYKQTMLWRDHQKNINADHAGTLPRLPAAAAD